ncbi:MAG TPA: acyl-CoA dehydrogenase family protein [Elainellaceae cyanobacterium]
MVQLFQNHDIKDYVAIAATLSDELSSTAAERDRHAGIPDEEVELIKKAGLISLSVPKEYGGAGASWIDAYRVIRELSKADGSTGQLYGNHVTLAALGRAIGTPEQADRYYRLVVENNWFIGNALNGRDARLKIAPEGHYFRANGVKSFGTGTISADLRVFAAAQDGIDFPVVFIVPSDRDGIVYNDDWNNMGQRRTASGSYSFNNVLVYADEILGPPRDPQSAFPSLMFVMAQLAKVNVYIGIAEGALNTAKQYTLTSTRPWITSGVDRISEDPFILHHYGEFWTDLKAAIALAEQAAQVIQTAWENGEALTFQERGEASIAVSTAKAFAIKVGLTITNRMFDVMGARATSAHYDFDRYWRDLRTFSLHDPVDYKLRDIGNWVLNHELPPVNQYS